MAFYRFLTLFSLFLFFSADISYSAPILMRIQQQKAIKQQRAQAEYAQQYQMYQQQQGGQPQGQGQPQQQTYDEQVDQRNHDIAQAIRDSKNTSVSSDVPQASNASADTPTGQNFSTSGMARPKRSPSPSAAKEVVDLSEIWKKLDKRSKIWTAMIDEQAKVLTVSEYINRYGNLGVKIKEPPLHYMQLIDQLAKENPQMLERPFGELIKVLAIVDYDFDNGMSKDDLARHVLGDAGFEQNKKRFSQ